MIRSTRHKSAREHNHDSGSGVGLDSREVAPVEGVRTRARVETGGRTNADDLQTISKGFSLFCDGFYTHYTTLTLEYNRA